MNTSGAATAAKCDTCGKQQVRLVRGTCIECLKVSDYGVFFDDVLNYLSIYPVFVLYETFDTLCLNSAHHAPIRCSVQTLFSRCFVFWFQRLQNLRFRRRVMQHFRMTKRKMLFDFTTQLSMEVRITSQISFLTCSLQKQVLISTVTDLQHSLN